MYVNHPEPTTSTHEIKAYYTINGQGSYELDTQGDNYMQIIDELTNFWNISPEDEVRREFGLEEITGNDDEFTATIEGEIATRDEDGEPDEGNDTITIFVTATRK